MNQQRNGKAWNPYLAGACTGLALVLSFFFTDQGFGATPFYDYTATIVLLLIKGVGLNAVDSLGRPELRPTWHLLFALGIPLGAFLGAYLFNDLRWQGVPGMWRQRFGGSTARRALGAFLGGAIAMLGARLAMGCPSGLGLSGMTVLSVGGFLGMAAFFIGGVLVAHLLFRRSSKGEAS